MNKKTIITALLALVAILLVSIVTKGQKKNVKSVEVKPKVAMEQKIMQEDDVLTYDISSVSDSASRIIIVIREYNQDGMIGEMKGQGLKMAKTLSIGFSPRQSVQSDSMVTVYVRSEHRNGLARDLVLKPVPDAPETIYLYEKVPFRVSAIRPNTFIPLALYGSFWWDSKYKICRFCGEKELTEENIRESDYFKHSPHYYIIGVIFHDNVARVVPL
ncbi:MAG: DUF5041 domain-containing protein [Prevotella sp.]|nr:DUF5041 domain-containing protein [Prevotella sp.]MBO7538127.1 DUF5041 domain-containing protein [Prevotella sp.]